MEQLFDKLKAKDRECIDLKAKVELGDSRISDLQQDAETI